MSDLVTMLWKESQELLFQRGWKGLILPVLLVGILGVYLPLQSGLRWLELTPIAIFTMIWIPFSVIISYIGDAIAGERERHTLESLLASRISDRAILLGKVIMTVGFGWGMGLVSLVLGLVLVNLLHADARWTFYHPIDLFLEVLLLSLLCNLLGTSAGVLISLRSATVRQAQQILGVGTLVMIFAGVLALQALPAGFIASLNSSQVMFLFIAVIAILDAILLGLSLVNFKRSRLIMS